MSDPTICPLVHYYCLKYGTIISKHSCGILPSLLAADTPHRSRVFANFVEFAGKAGHAVHHLPVGAIVQAVKLEESIISAFISVLGSLKIEFNQAKRACKISAMLTLSFAMDGWSLN